MSDYQLTYNTLQSQASRRIVQDAVTEGLLWPLVFVMGFNEDSVLEAIWTMIVLFIGYGMVRSYMSKRETRQRLLVSALKKQCLGPESWDSSLWETVRIQKGREVLVEAALDIHDLEGNRGPDEDLRCSFTDAIGMLRLQYSLSMNAQDLELNLRLADSTYPLEAKSPGTDSEATAAMGTHQRNLEAVEELTTQTHSQAIEVSQQLEAILPALQALKGKSAHSYQVAVAEFAQETATVFERLQARAG
jgi:hypothetical protein